MFLYLFLSGVCEICVIVMGYNNVAARCRRRGGDVVVEEVAYFLPLNSDNVGLNRC